MRAFRPWVLNQPGRILTAYAIYTPSDGSSWACPCAPPGVGYLLALVWDGEETGLPALRFLWGLLGALTVPLIFLSASRSFGFRVGLAAGLLTAGSTGMMILSSSLNNEVPYLLLVVAAFTLCGTCQQL